MKRFIEIQEISLQLKPSTVLIKNQGSIGHISGIITIKIRTFVISRERMLFNSQPFQDKTVNSIKLQD